MRQFFIVFWQSIIKGITCGSKARFLLGREAKRKAKLLDTKLASIKPRKKAKCNIWFFTWYPNAVTDKLLKSTKMLHLACRWSLSPLPRACCLFTKLCLTLWDPWTLAHQALLSMEILQARTLEWIAMPLFRWSSQPRDWTQVSHIAGGFFTDWITREAQEYWSG